jgi:hypothetical protein
MRQISVIPLNCPELAELTWDRQMLLFVDDKQLSSKYVQVRRVRNQPLTNALDPEYMSATKPKLTGLHFLASSQLKSG